MKTSRAAASAKENATKYILLFDLRMLKKDSVTLLDSMFEISFRALGAMPAMQRRCWRVMNIQCRSCQAEDNILHR